MLVLLGIFLQLSPGWCAAWLVSCPMVSSFCVVLMKICAFLSFESLYKSCKNIFRIAKFVARWFLNFVFARVVGKVAKSSNKIAKLTTLDRTNLLKDKNTFARHCIYASSCPIEGGKPSSSLNAERSDEHSDVPLHSAILPKHISFFSTLKAGACSFITVISIIRSVLVQHQAC